MTESSYRVDCEECERSIPASARYCQFCGVEQQRALRAIERMRSAQGDEIRTDGGEDARLRDDVEHIPLWLWWLFVVALCTVFVVILWNAGVVA